METVLHVYNFDTRNPEEAKAWEALKGELKAGSRLMESYGDYFHGFKDLDGAVIDLDPTFLFDNQWNTLPITGYPNGVRVFDWALEYVQDMPHIKRGYYLEQTSEMAQIRADTLKCGYCGHQKHVSEGLTFCPDCLDSEYLDEETLRKGATRLIPVREGHNWTPLVEEEAADLLPRFTEAQIHGSTKRGKVRIAKIRLDLQSEYGRSITSARNKYDGMIWLLDHGISTENVIYYSHTGKFCFGWRTPCSHDVTSKLLDLLTEFPFDYDIKSESRGLVSA